jgi:hypothetical protein
MKITPRGPRYSGQAFEFGGHRLQAVTKLLGEAATALEQIKGDRNETP